MVKVAYLFFITICAACDSGGMEIKMKNFSGTVVIIGVSSGIGETCALYLSKLGFHVFAGVRKESDIEKLKLKASGCLEPVLIDVTDVF